MELWVHVPGVKTREDLLMGLGQGLELMTDDM